MTQPSSEQAAPGRPGQDALERMAMIRTHYPTPEATLEGMRRELDAFLPVMRAARAHWTEVMPGRQWSPAQEAEHTILVNEGSGKLARLLLSDKPLRGAPQRPGERGAEGRWQAPPGTEPGEAQRYEALLARHEATRALLEVQARPDPQRTFFHPFMGQLDALDWLRMAAFQTGHHRRSLQKGLDALDAESGVR